MKKLIILLAIVIPFISSAQPKEEVRAVWLTTVWGLDWPKTYSVATQKSDMIEILDSLKSANFNTVMFQVRARGDLMYPSVLEPWAKSLTGTLGQDPGWDPLQFVIDECHARGMEVHAWFVTYKVYSGQNPPPSTSPEHIVNAHPELCKLYESGGTYGWWMDPGIPETRQYLVNVAMEMVNNYDLDALHFDYIRYPGSDFDDADTYATYGNGQDIGDWRRANINQFVYDVYDSVQSVKPWVKVGSAPIGIYHNIPGASGWQGYYDVYQDARDWAQQGKHDYICPQVYWTMSSRFPYLVDDWVANSYGKPIYTGIAAYQMESKKDILAGDHESFWYKAMKDSPKGWSADEILNQLDYTRTAGGYGQTYFRTLQITYNIKNIHTLLKNGQYKYPANIPPMPWKDNVPPNKPKNLSLTANNSTSFTLNWDAPDLPSDGDTVKYYNVYQSESSPVNIDDIKNVVKFQIMGTTSVTINYETAPQNNIFYTVTAYDKGYNESVPADEVNLSNFNLIQPGNSSSDNLTEVKFIWETKNGANSYVLQVSDDSDFSNLIINETNVTDTFFTYGNFSYNKTYFWRVKPDNLATWSSVWSFKTSRLETLWIKNTENANLPTWFSTSANTERGIAYGSGHLYIVSRSGGTAVKILNAADGSDIGNLDVSAVSGGIYALNDVETGTDGSILACNLTTDAGTSPFKIYKWDNETAAPVEYINYTASASYRLGDNFSLTGDLNGNAVIYAAASGTNVVFRWTVTGGNLNSTPEIITLSGISDIGTSPSVAPLGNTNTDDFYVNGHSAVSPTLFSADGTLKGTIPSNITGQSNSSIQTFMYQGFRYTSAFQSADAVNSANGQNALVLIENAPVNDLYFDARYGTSEKTGNNTNTYAVGDIVYKNDISGSEKPIIYVLSTNNGFGAFRFTELPPVAENVNISGTEEVFYTLTGNYTYSDANGDLEGNSIYQWYRADDANGTGKTAITGATNVSYDLTEEDEGKFLFFEITPAAQSGIEKGATVSVVSGAISASTAAAPVASNVYISGNLETGQVLTGNYTYSDANGDLEGNSIYQWNRADDTNGTNFFTIIGANQQTYTLTQDDLGKYMIFRVTPVAQTGSTQESLTGSITFSDYYGPVALDVKTLAENKIKLYPNPVYDVLKIQNTESVEQISVLDILGKTVMQFENKSKKRNAEINFKNTKKGIYILKFKTFDGTVFSKKVTKF